MSAIWSREFPTRDGYYNAADPKALIPRVVMIDGGRLHLYCDQRHQFIHACDKEGLDFDLIFSGPIKMPTGP